MCDLAGAQGWKTEGLKAEIGTRSSLLARQAVDGSWTMHKLLQRGCLAIEIENSPQLGEFGQSEAERAACSVSEG